MKKLTPITLSVLLLVGCSSSTELDTSSKEALHKSAEQMYNELDSDEKKAEFNQALQYLFMKSLTNGLFSFAGRGGGEKVDINTYDGLTAEEVVAKVKAEIEASKK